MLCFALLFIVTKWGFLKIWSCKAWLSWTEICTRVTLIHIALYDNIWASVTENDLGVTKCSSSGTVCELQSAQSLALLIKCYFLIAGSNFSHSWHNLHDCEYDSYCNGLDLQSPKFQTSLTCGDN